MSNEEQSFQARRTQIPIIKRRYPCLAGSGGGDDEVAIVASAALNIQRLQHLPLMGLRLEIEVERQDRIQPIGCGAGPLAGEGVRQALTVRIRVVADEFGLVPVLLERGTDSVQDCRIVDLTDPDVPLEALDQGGMGQIGRADVCGMEA